MVGGGMSVRRTVAAADVPAGNTTTQVHPTSTNGDAVGAALIDGGGAGNGAHVRTVGHP